MVHSSDDADPATTLSPKEPARQRYETFADSLVNSALAFASPSGALLSIPGPASASGRWSSEHEGYARTFLAAAFRVRGANGADPHGWIERYATGLRAGVDPTHPERWPTIGERRQSIVEAASIAVALSETKPWLWDALDERTQSQTIDYLAGVVGTGGYSNNWSWFQTVIEAFLARVGGPWSSEDLDRAEASRAALYVGEGWYSDGASTDGVRQNFDYYAGWAWHVYPLLHARIESRELESEHRDRLHAYIRDAVELVGSTGAPLFQGRSLTYRFAMLGPFWAAAIAGVSPLATGETLDLSDRVIDYFRSRGAVDDRGILSIGWHREFLPLRQRYTGGGSPYWASKGLLGLLLPAEHPEWSTQPSTVEQSPVRQRALSAPGWIVVRTESDGIVRVLNHGTDGERHLTDGARVDRPFYQRLAYSNVTAPDLTPAGIAAPRDNHTSLVDESGTPSHRGRIERVFLSDRVAVSRSRVHWVDLPGSAHRPDSDAWAGMRLGPVVTTASVVNGIHELRLAWYRTPIRSGRPTKLDDMDAAWRDATGPWRFRFDGWALPKDAADAPLSSTRADLHSRVFGVRSIETTGVRTELSATPFSGASETPWAESGIVRPGDVVAALVILASDEPDSTVLPRIDMTDDAITVSWPDGRVDVVPSDGNLR